MELSDAITKGSKLRPKAVGRYFSKDGSCAWGAAFEGAKTGILVPHLQCRLWPVIVQYVPCPQCGRVDSVANLIVELNDDHRMSREAIAMWIGTLEAKRATDQEPDDSLDAGKTGGEALPSGETAAPSSVPDYVTR